jgi:hypothetical protein
MADRRDIERLVQKLEEQPSLPPGAVRDIWEAIDTSPYLATVMTKAIEMGTLRRIEVSNRPHEGGHYDDRTGTLSINADAFDFANRSARLDLLVGTLGHETGHALMAHSAQLSLNTFVYKLDQKLKEGIQYGDPIVDATALSADFMESARQNEALAELVSMNAVASRVVTTKGAFNEADLLQRLDPITTCVNNGLPEKGIQFDERGFQRPRNGISSPEVEAVAVCHFDKSASTLGLKGISNYHSLYAAYTIAAGAELWRERSASTTQVVPKLAYNLSELGVSAQQAEDAGVDLGGVGKTFGFVDTSHGQQRMVEVRQLGPGQQRPDAAPEMDAPAPTLANDPGHSDHGTYQRIHEWAKGTGHWSDEQGLNVAAALYKRQAEDPLVRRVDKVSGGMGEDGAENVFAVYAPFGEKGPFFHVHVDAREAVQQPAQQNLQQAEQIRLEQVRQQQLELTQQQPSQAQSVPSRSL